MNQLRYFVLLIGLYTSHGLFGQNFGFEYVPGTTPPFQWTQVTGTWNTETNPTLTRTGKQCMHINTMSGTGTTLYNTSAYVPVSQAGGYLITMAWTKSDISNATLYLGYRGTTTILNPSVLTSGQPINVSAVNWNRIISISAATVVQGNYGPSMRAYRSDATIATNLYIDDVIVYWSPVAVADTIAPSAVSNVLLSQSGGNPMLSWTNGIDGLSGLGGVVILRANGVQTNLPVLHDQAMYSPQLGAMGSDTVMSGGVVWQVAGSINDSTTTSFIDLGASAGTTYTYAIYQRDIAYNYASGVSPVACVAAPPASVAQAASSSACVGQIVQVYLSSAFTDYIYQWQYSLNGTNFIDMPGATSDTINVMMSAPMHFRCVLTCFNVGSTPSSSVFIALNPSPETGTMQVVQTSGFTFNFSLPNAQNVDLYLWDFGNGNTSSSPTPTYQYPVGGDYLVKVSVFNACGQDSSQYQITGLSNNDLTESVSRVYPNPAKDQLFVDGLISGDKLELYNMLGQGVKTHTSLNSQSQWLNISDLPTGMYILRVIRKSGATMESFSIEVVK